MRAQSEKSRRHELPAETRPIEFLTENGFSIFRLWEIGHKAPPANGRYEFSVRSPQNLERNISVEIADRVIAQITIRTGGRILLSSPFWICCAENHLANYVWEHGNFPESNSLVVECLDPEEIILATRWGRREPGQD